jgi:hypothetical protein
MKVAVYGYKHDAGPYETLLKDFCQLEKMVGKSGAECGGRMKGGRVKAKNGRGGGGEGREGRRKGGAKV